MKDLGIDLTTQKGAAGINHMAETIELDAKEIEIAKYQSLSWRTKKYIESTFHNISSMNEEERKYQRSFMNFCKNFDEIKETGAGILLQGTEGTGKTLYSYAISNELDKKYKVYRTSLSLYLDDVKVDFDEKYYLNLVKEADLLIINDLGNEHIKDWALERVYNLFNTAYEEKISMIIDTNLDDEGLEKFLNIRGSSKLISRLKAKCKRYVFDWEDRRIAENKKYFEKFF